MAAPKPLKTQEYHKDIQKILECKKSAEFLNYDSTLEDNVIYTLLDRNQKEFCLIPRKIIQTLTNELKNLENDRYLFDLEKEIYKNMPIDFDDVWCIALREVKDYKKDPKAVVKHLKSRYPYLFLSFSDQFDTK